MRQTSVPSERHRTQASAAVLPRRRSLASKTRSWRELRELPRCRTPGTNRIASITTPAGTRTFTPDTRGNLASEDRPGSADVTVGYDGYARLTSYDRIGEATLAMAYNGMDQRAALTSGGITRRFVYDMDGRLLG